MSTPQAEPEPMVNLTVRVPKALADAIDEIARERTSSGAKGTRQSVVAWMIERGIVEYRRKRTP